MTVVASHSFSHSTNTTWVCDLWEDYRHWVENDYQNPQHVLSPHWDYYLVVSFRILGTRCDKISGFLSVSSPLPFPARNSQGQWGRVSHLNCCDRTLNAHQTSWLPGLCTCDVWSLAQTWTACATTQDAQGSIGNLIYMRTVHPQALLLFTFFP